MGRTYTILQINNTLTFTGLTTTLALNDGYYTYDQQGLNKGIVTEFNVKQYLNDSNNATIATDFFNYLEKNTTQEQFLEIYNDNKRLSDLFKQYYDTSVLFATPSPVSYINNSLAFTTGITTNNLNFALSSSTVTENVMTGTPASIMSINRLNDTKEQLTTYTTDPSYYINVPINFSLGLFAPQNFSDYLQDEFLVVSGQTITLKNGFVNLNITSNQDEFWK